MNRYILAAVALLAAGAARAQGIASLATPIAPVQSSAVESNHVLRSKPGAIYGLSVTSGASAGYVLVFDATVAPADGAVTPVFCYQLPATSTVSVSYAPAAAFANGAVVVFSTTGCFTKTASATAFIAGLPQ